MAAALDRTGDRHGLLTVISRAGSNKHGQAMWLCSCACGEMTTVNGNYLRNGDTKSCGCLAAQPLEIAGRRFGRLKALCRTGSSGKGAIWLCECTCGTRIETLGKYLTNGDTKSCGNQFCRPGAHNFQPGERFGSWTVLARVDGDNKGSLFLCACDCGTTKSIRGSHLAREQTRACRKCSARGRNKKHGMTGTPVYQAWQNMKDRCCNPKNPGYADYGGRGIKVCDRWLAFLNFYADMGDRPDGLSLDRIDPNGDYEPANCRWADNFVQQQNKRPRVSNAEHAAALARIAELEALVEQLSVLHGAA
jgi:hypothetical protein